MKEIIHQCPFSNKIFRSNIGNKINNEKNNSKVTKKDTSLPIVPPLNNNSLNYVKNKFIPWGMGALAQTLVTYPLKISLISTQTNTSFTQLWFKDNKNKLTFIELSKKTGIIKTIKLGYQGSTITFINRFSGLLISDYIKESLSSQSQYIQFAGVTTIQAALQTKMDYDSLKSIKGQKSALMNKVCNTRFQIFPFTTTFLRESFFIGALFFNPYDYKENKLGFLLTSMLAGAATTGLDSLKTIYQNINLEQPTFAIAVEKSYQSTKSITVSDFFKLHISKASGIRSLMVGLGIFSAATGKEFSLNYINNIQ